MKKYREIKLEGIATRYDLIDMRYWNLMSDAPYRQYLIKGRTI